MIYSIDDYKECIPLNTIQGTAYYMAAEARALRILRKFVGAELVAKISDTPDLKTAAKMAVVNLSYMEGLPFLNVVSTATGFGIVSNQNTAPASKDRTEALKQALISAFQVGLDELLEFLEDQTDLDWSKSTILTGLVKNSKDATNALYEYISRPAFYELRFRITEYEETIIIPSISQQQYDDIKDSDTDSVKKDLQKATLLFAQEEHTKSKHFFDKAISALIAAPDTYALYHANAYEAPYENDLDDDENGTFVTA